MQLSTMIKASKQNLIISQDSLVATIDFLCLRKKTQ